MKKVTFIKKEFNIIIIIIIIIIMITKMLVNINDELVENKLIPYMKKHKISNRDNAFNNILEELIL